MEKMDTALVLRASNPVQNMNVDVNKEEIDENSSDEIIEEMVCHGTMNFIYLFRSQKMKLIVIMIYKRRRYGDVC